MRRLLPGLMLVLLGLPTVNPAGETTLGGHTFTLPEGFTIELVAGPPLVDRPITASFDDQGRLYVSDSSGTNDKVTVQLEQKPHQVLRLEDTDGDGRYDKRTVFADKMMFPEGTLWHDGSLYVAAPPSIWKLTDTNNDGVADERVEWFQGKTLTGCANDLHGPYLGPDGWIYWCKGAFAEQTYERPGKKPFVTKASHIFRCKPDGTGIEQVMTGGMDNPVDTAFTPEGDRIFTTTFLQHPAGGLRDGLIHAVYGGVYGKDNAVLEGHPRTGELMPILSHLGAAAPCGLTRYESDTFGKSYQDNLFACLFNMHKVTRHVVEPSGAGLKATDTDFVVSSNVDFHPTDILEDADGSLLIVDTGGWYKLCCPTSQLWKPDVLGGIYRVRKAGAKAPADPRGLKIDWKAAAPDELATLLSDQRPVVQQKAIREIVRRGAEGLRVIGLALLQPDPPSPVGPRNAIWAAMQIDHPEARKVISRGLDVDGTYAVVALHAVSLRRWNEFRGDVVELLESKSPRVRRAAAEALGRIGDAASVPALLHAAAKAIDRTEEHSIAYALIEIADATGTAAGLKSPHPRTQRTALLALDAMDNGGLKAADVAPLLASPEPLLRETATYLVDRHPEWGDDLSGVLAARLKGAALNDSEQAELLKQLSRFAKSTSVQRLLVSTVSDSKVPVAIRLLALQAIGRSGAKEMPAECLTAIVPLLSSGPNELRGPAVSALRAVPPSKAKAGEVAAALIATAGQADLSPQVRAEALAAVPGGVPGLSDELFAFLKANVDVDKDVLLRATVSDALSRSKLTTAQQATLTEAFANVGPLEADRVLAAFKDCADEAVGLKLVAALKESSVLQALRVDTLKSSLEKFPPAVHEKAKELYAALNVDPEKQKARLESILASLQPGDVRRGHLVFHSPKAACIVCHAMGYLGGRVGPDLSRIGSIRTERDLLESIIFPSSSFVRSYEPVVVATTAGKIHTGIMKSEGAEIVLATGPKEEVRIPREDVEEIRPGNASVMPSGLEQQLSPQELADLIAFLKNAK